MVAGDDGDGHVDDVWSLSYYLVFFMGITQRFFETWFKGAKFHDIHQGNVRKFLAW